LEGWRRVRPERCKNRRVEGVPTQFDGLLSRGNTSDVYALGVDAVIKVPRADVPDHWIEIEARHATTMHQAGLPTPMVLDVLEVDGRPSIVFERVDGPSMLDELAASPDRADELAADMAALQRELFQATAPAELPDLRERVAGKIETAPGIATQDRGEVLELLGTLPSGRAVCHGDLHPGNILLGTQGPMVIDWFDSTAGPPIADVVRTSLIIRPLPPHSTRLHLAGVAPRSLDRFHRTYVDRMRGVLGTNGAEALSWEGVLAVSRLAEPVDAERNDLISIWRSRADLALSPVTLLAELLLGDARSEQ